MLFKKACMFRAKLAVLYVSLLIPNSAICLDSDVVGHSLVHLQVDPGTPLRIYITHRVRYRLGEPVHATLIEPVWVYDRSVIPSGASLDGQVSELQPVPKMERFRAMLGGDFTALKLARVSFTRLTLPDGRVLSLQTDQALGLGTIYVPPKPPKKPKKAQSTPAKPSIFREFLTQQARTQVQSQANARSHGIYDLVRGPNKKEWIENYALSKMPVHPQWYRARTRFDVVLSQPLDFGTVQIPASELAEPNMNFPPASVVQMRLLTSLTSADARVGDPVEGVSSEPLFTGQHQLLLPQGTRFSGRVTFSEKARLFHRGGKLRFTIDNVEPQQTENAGQPDGSGMRAVPGGPGQLLAVEANPQTTQVDAEGTAKGVESKTRFIRPVVAALVAVKSLDNDAGKQTASGGGAAPNNLGRSLGGFSGFGLLGILASRGPHEVGAALGFYGLAWSVYSTVVARGSELSFKKDTAIAIRFATPREK